MVMNLSLSKFGIRGFGKNLSIFYLNKQLKKLSVDHFRF